MSLSVADITTTTSDLAGLLVSSDLKSFLESQGSLPELQKQVKGMTNAASTLNQEFSERRAMMGGTYQLPLFGTNQDIVLLGFFFSYIFLTVVSLLTVYKNTQSIRSVLYGFCLSIVVLLISTGLLFRIA